MPDDPKPRPSATPAGRVPFPESGLVVVPTLEGFQHLTERVTALERAPRATVPAPALERLEQLEQRQQRHRDELEDVKRQWNELLRALGLVPPTTPPAPLPAVLPPPTMESYQ